MHSQAYYERKKVNWDRHYVGSKTPAIELLEMIKSGAFEKARNAMRVIEQQLANNFKPLEVDEFVDIEEVDPSKMGSFQRELKDPSLPAFASIAREIFNERVAVVNAAFDWLHSHQEVFFKTGRYTPQNKKESKLGLELGAGFFVISIDDCTIELLHPCGAIKRLFITDVMTLVQRAIEEERKVEEQRLAKEERERLEEEVQRQLEQEQARKADEARKAKEAEDARKAEEDKLLNGPFGALMQLKKGK